MSAVLTLLQVVRAQEQCTALLQHGIYDKFRETNVGTSSSQFSSHLCQAYNKLKQDKAAGHAEASYGLIGGEGSFSSEQLEAVGQFMCTATASSSDISNNLSLVQDRISQPAIDAWRECLSLYADGLRTKTTFREDDQGQITVELRYVAPPGAPPQTTINKIVSSPADAFACSGPLWDLQGKPNMVGTQTVAMSCDRKLTAPFTYNNLTLRAMPNTITVMTTAGTLTRNMTYVLAGPPATPITLPIGTIISFHGTMADAVAQRQNGWWVCDGTVVNDPLADPAYRNQATPKLTDRFLLAATQAGQVGGKKSYDIPTQTIHSHTNGGFGPPQIYGDPFTHMQGSHSWTTDASIYSEGDWSGVNVPTLPPYYSVIYLIKVK